MKDHVVFAVKIRGYQGFCKHKGFSLALEYSKLSKDLKKCVCVRVQGRCIIMRRTINHAPFISPDTQE